MGRPYRRSITGALVLIALGVIFLYSNFRPGFDPWSILSRYWPLLLIFWGLGRIFDYFMFERENVNAGARSYGGEVFAILILVVLFLVAAGHSHFHRGKLAHDQESIGLKGASSVDVTVDLPSGQLTVAPGANTANALEADLSYREWDAKPEVDYDVHEGRGTLRLSRDNMHIRTSLGTSDNHWDLRLNDLTSNLDIHMGAGQSNVNVSGLHLSRLSLEIGAGQVNADLTGDWKKNLEVSIQGGVGSGHIRLPKNVGVEVSVSGGIGSVSSDGLKKRDSEYVNDAYGQSPVTVRVTVEGGVGNIELELEK